MINKYIQPSDFNNGDKLNYLKSTLKNEIENIEPLYDNKNSLISTKDFQLSKKSLLESSEISKLNDTYGDFKH